MSYHLTCDHCGGTAIGSEVNRFYDGTLAACFACGIPGMITGDSETPATWDPSDEPGDKCRDASCEECYPEASRQPLTGIWVRRVASVFYATKFDGNGKVVCSITCDGLVQITEWMQEVLGD